MSFVLLELHYLMTALSCLSFFQLVVKTETVCSKLGLRNQVVLPFLISCVVSLYCLIASSYTVTIRLYRRNSITDKVRSVFFCF